MGGKIIETTGMPPGILLHNDMIHFGPVKVINSATVTLAPVLKSHLKTLLPNQVKSGIWSVKRTIFNTKNTRLCFRNRMNYRLLPEEVSLKR